MQKHTAPLRLRSAFTLLELLLAVAVIAVLAGITVPSALRMHANSQLSDAAAKVRDVVGQSRLNAIGTGEQYQFRYEKDGRHFIQIPVEIPAAATQTNASTATTALPRPPSVLGELPKGMRFEALTQPSSTLDSLGPPLTADHFQGLPKAQDLVSLAWSPPVVFSANGSANDASWLVVDQRKQSIKVDVRGLTGAASLGAMAPFRDR